MNDKGARFLKDLKKWGLFLVVLILLPVLYLLISPGGEDEARQLVAEAESLNRKAQGVAEKTNAPQDLANLDLSTESLDVAKSLLVESDFTAARDAAEKSKIHSLKVTERQPPTGATRARVRFQDLAGEVEVRKRYNPGFEPATRETALEVGDTVRTGPSGGCKLTFSSRLDAVLRVSSKLSFPDLTGDIAGSDLITDLLLEDGSIHLKTSELVNNQKTEVITELGKASIYQNTEARIIYRPASGAMEVRVRLGRVETRVGTTTVNVVKDQALIIRQGQPLGQPKPMPEPPQLLEPANFARFEANQNGIVMVTLSWRPVAASGQYHIELAATPLFNQLIFEKTGFLGDNVAVQGLSRGNYYWRVSSIGRDEQEGLPSQVRQFEVDDPGVTSPVISIDTTPPLLKVTDVLVQGYIVIVQGRSERDAKVTVEGEKAVLDEETGEFKCTLNFHDKGTYAINVVAVDRVGNRTAEQFNVEIRD